MAEARIETPENIPTDHALLARYGISLLINNRSTEAQELFKNHMDDIQMSAGYSFASFMDALMSFEEERLDQALNILKETERKCVADMGWLKSVKTKMFGAKKENVAEKLESQIILADVQVCVAIITFLQQEFSGYLKGGWILRKAWRIYHQTYMEIVDIYKKKFGNFNLPEPTDFEWQDTATSSFSRSSSSTTDGQSCEWNVPENDVPIPSPSHRQNGYVPISSPIKKCNMSHSQSTFVFTKSSDYFPFAIKRSGSAHSTLDSSNLKSANNKSTYSLLSPISTHISYLTSTLSLLTSPDKKQVDDMAPELISRLMGAVCFGYGALQLGISLLPPSLLKVTNFFGFHGNRAAGISNLMYARKGTDMRAPLAMLALLWYHTIVRPFYALDGHNVKAGLEAASLLMKESQNEYGKSALFLFFQGRIYRLDSNISKALESFQAAADNSMQREIKLLALHEVGWCHLIQLDYKNAQKVFFQLMQSSRWSRSFYVFLTIICAASNNQKEYNSIRDFKNQFLASGASSTQLDVYLQRRLKVFPDNEEDLRQSPPLYWKFFVYELIFLWNALPSCSHQAILNIIEDCNNTENEPMPGLTMLIQGECYNILQQPENAISSFRNCIAARSKIVSKDDQHISAFAEYALGALLLKNAETMAEGKSLLQNVASQYKDSDFNNKLHVRIDMALKSVP